MKKTILFALALTLSAAWPTAASAAPFRPFSLHPAKLFLCAEPFSFPPSTE